MIMAISHVQIFVRH